MATDEPTFTGPRIGDRVHIEVRGAVVVFEGRHGVPGALVDLDEDGEPWVPLDAVVLLRHP